MKFFIQAFSYKSQPTIYKEQTNPNTQTIKFQTTYKDVMEMFEIWILRVEISLRFGICFL